ncbi:hypothetical protein [Vibrio penaeicida]|nr:hypothetical protein [Vibrio penaeicida]
MASRLDKSQQIVFDEVDFSRLSAYKWHFALSIISSIGSLEIDN